MESQEEASLTAQRQIHDAFISAGGVKNVNITMSIILAVRNSRARYVEFLKGKRKMTQRRLRMLQ